MKLLPVFAALALVILTAGSAGAQTHSVALTWTASASAAANPSLTYNVYRSPGCSGTFTRLNSSAVTATSFTDAGVAPGTYCYQVTAVLNGSESAPTNQAAAVVPAPAPPRQTARLRPPRLARRLDPLRRFAPACAAQGTRAVANTVGSD